MRTAYLGMTVLVALMAAFSGLGKIRRDPRQVKVIHRTVGVPLEYFPLLAVCEFAGALGLLAGMWRAETRSRGGNRPGALLRGGHRLASACRRLQRRWVCRLHVGARGGSTHPSRSDDVNAASPGSPGSRLHLEIAHRQGS